MENKTITSPRIWQENNLTFTEVIRQEYNGNNCIVSAGFVEGVNKPPVDTIFLKLEKNNVTPTVLLLRPDEMQAISWVVAGTIWSHLMQEKRQNESLTKT